jgi:acyl-CoA hydrolase
MPAHSNNYQSKYVSAAFAASLIKSGDRVYIHGMAATPHVLIEAMVARAHELRNVEIIHMHTEGEAPYNREEYADSFTNNLLFVAPNMRAAVAGGRADYIPMFLSEIPGMIRKRRLPINVALLHVSPPDEHGYCTLGTSVEVSNAAGDSADIVIAQVNPQMPRTYGDGLIHVNKLTAMVQVDAPIHAPAPTPPNETEQRIGNHVAELVEDGATIQMGIGAIPNAVLAALIHHKRLGVHTEMFSDGVIDLVERGVITGEEKKLNHEKIVAGFVLGSRRLYDFVHNNLEVELLDVGYVNDTHIIRQNPKVTAINSAIEVDLTGQVCADSIGTYQYSGVGGQMDFIRGASLSQGGKPIIALPSTTSKGETRIVPYLKQGAGVTTTRAHVHYIATEYGVVDLYGLNMRQRAKALIQIAHPMHREALEKEAYERFKRL